MNFAFFIKSINWLMSSRKRNSYSTPATIWNGKIWRWTRHVLDCHTSQIQDSWKMYVRSKLDIYFCQITMFIKVCLAPCFWASDPLIKRFFKNMPIKGSEAQKPRPHKPLWTLWFDEKVALRFKKISIIYFLFITFYLHLDSLILYSFVFRE